MKNRWSREWKGRLFASLRGDSPTDKLVQWHNTRPAEGFEGEWLDQRLNL